MNSSALKKKLDPDSARLFAALSVIESEENCMKEFKTAFLESSTEAKKQVRSSVSSFIETLKEREEKLCQQIDEHILQVIFWKEKSRENLLMEDSSFDCDACSLPIVDIKFVDDSGNLEQKLKKFGSIEVTSCPVDVDIKKNAAPSRCSASPINIDTPSTSPESAGSVESFDVISCSDLAEAPPKPKPALPSISVNQLLLYGIETVFSRTEQEPEREDQATAPMEASPESHKPEIPLHPVTALKNQLKPYNKDDPKPDAANRKHTADSTTRNEQPSPSSIIKEKFGEYLCSGEHNKWLASAY